MRADFAAIVVFSVHRCDRGVTGHKPKFSFNGEVRPKRHQFVLEHECACSDVDCTHHSESITTSHQPSSSASVSHVTTPSSSPTTTQQPADTLLETLAAEVTCDTQASTIAEIEIEVPPSESGDTFQTTATTEPLPQPTLQQHARANRLVGGLAIRFPVEAPLKADFEETKEFFRANWELTVPTKPKV